MPHTTLVFDVILSLTSSLPLRSVFQFLVLLTGAIVNPGHVTDALCGSGREHLWSSSYKWLRLGRWSHVMLGRKMCELVSGLKQHKLFLVYDDTVIYRCSNKAPGSKIHHEHSKKPNRSQYVLGQCLVVLVATKFVPMCGPVSIPLLSRLTPTTGNTGKLTAARVIWRTVKEKFCNNSVYMLLDAWYMKAPLINYLLQEGVHVIGNIRGDSAVFELPPIKKETKRGRPRKYGARIYREQIERKRFAVRQMTLYNAPHKVHYQAQTVKAKFLGGRVVKVVWVKLEKVESGNISRLKLFLSTDTTMSAVEIIDAYARRWSVESFFHQIKNAWGLQQAWQQHRQTFARWTQLLYAAYFVPAYLLAKEPEKAVRLAIFQPWRNQRQLTVGVVQQGVQRILAKFDAPAKLTKLAKIKGAYQRVKRKNATQMAA